MDSDGQSEAVDRTLAFEAGDGVGRRVYALVLALAFASFASALDLGTLEVDFGIPEVERDKALGHTWGAVLEQRALAMVESVQDEMEEPGIVVA